MFFAAPYQSLFMKPVKCSSKTLLIYTLYAIPFLLCPALMGQSGNKTQSAATGVPPKTWIDLDTGHRITRLTDEPNSQSLYFDENAYTPDGRDMIYLTPTGIYDLNLATLKSTVIASGKLTNIVVGSKTRRVFYENLDDGETYSTEIDTQKVTKYPGFPVRGILTTVNSDETLLAGTLIEGHAPEFNHYLAQALAAAKKEQDDNSQAQIAKLTAEFTAHPEAKPNASPGSDIVEKARAVAIEQRFASNTPQDIFVFDLKTKMTTIILKGTDWINHVQFSPTDPNILRYSHEGPSQKVDRVWTVHADGTRNQLMHRRDDPAGIATHEFWSADGKTVWFDLQQQKGEDFSVAGIDVSTGHRTVYHLTKAQASVHYNVAPDGSVFCGDGNVTAHGEIGVNGHRTLDRAWIELLRPAADGSFHSTRLAHIPKNDYSKAEPNARFSPDKKMIIFSSNMFGATYIFGVEVAKPPASSGAVQ